MSLTIVSRVILSSGYSPFFHPFAQKIAEYSFEILVAGVGQKAPWLGKHTHKISEKRKVGKRFKLRLHTAFGIAEPPSGAVLNFSLHLGAPKTAEHRIYKLVIIGIKRINNSFRKLVLNIKSVKEARKRLAAVFNRNAVKPRIAPNLLNIAVFVFLCAP